jgi:predicted nucleotidyltransferase
MARTAPLNSEWIELLRSFNASGVKYLVVGGHAVMFYAEPRYTKDLDLWIEASPENAHKTFTALANFGAPLSGMSPQDFEREGFVYQLGVPPVRVDIVMSIDGVTFAEAWPNRREAACGSEKVAYIGREDLIKNKIASGRHIDLHDAELLKKSR